jgi:hypothetical protein
MIQPEIGATFTEDGKTFIDCAYTYYDSVIGYDVGWGLKK